MYLTFWGVRGSYPVPGTATVRYGGQTSCIEVRTEDGQCLIVDAGTGLRSLGKKLAVNNLKQRNSTYDFVLSHVHWDHIQGLPFFEPVYQEGNQIRIHAPRAAEEELRHVIGGITRREFFPVALETSPATFHYSEVVPGQSFNIGAFDILPIGLNHPFGAVGYRIKSDESSLAYVSDTAPFDCMLHKHHFVHGIEEPNESDRKTLQNMRASLVAALQEVDTVVYDTHFTTEEYNQFPHWGHSTPEHALEICQEASVKRLVLYHHAPSHDDDIMDQIGETYSQLGAKQGIEVLVAKETMTLVMGKPFEQGKQS